MLITEREVVLKKPHSYSFILGYLKKQIHGHLSHDLTPIRFVITKIDEENIFCEVGVIHCDRYDTVELNSVDSIFAFRPRRYENAERFNIVLIIPTGVGCELGGHSGDGGAVARLLASISDQLITHPNVVNAADINELPENGLYVEGSILSRLLMGTITLQKVRSNRVLLVIDKHEEPFFHELAINAASAARASLGLDCPRVTIMEEPIRMKAEFMDSGRAAGSIEGFDRLYNLLDERQCHYDAVALSTLISVPSNYHADYFDDEKTPLVNPWGGVEAMLTHAVSSIYNIPSAHSPMMTSSAIMNLDVGIVDPRKAAEAVSSTYLHCILKGLQRAPRVILGMHSGEGLLSSRDVSCIVIPDGCIGLPVLAALESGIPVIAVGDRHAKTANSFLELPFAAGKIFYADNYLEAAGIAASIKAGVALGSVVRPMPRTTITTKRRSSDALAMLGNDTTSTEEE